MERQACVVAADEDEDDEDDPDADDPDADAEDEPDPDTDDDDDPDDEDEDEDEDESSFPKVTNAKLLLIELDDDNVGLSDNCPVGIGLVVVNCTVSIATDSDETSAMLLGCNVGLLDNI
jgi:hypothetical protein